MGYAPKIVLQLPISRADLLAPFVEACIRDGVALIAIVGDNCAAVEDTIDELVVGDGSDKRRFLVTSAHPDETLEQAMAFASMFDANGRQGVELVKL